MPSLARLQCSFCSLFPKNVLLARSNIHVLFTTVPRRYRGDGRERNDKKNMKLPKSKKKQDVEKRIRETEAAASGVGEDGDQTERILKQANMKSMGERMDFYIEKLREIYQGITVGRASPAALDQVKVYINEITMPLKSLAQITVKPGNVLSVSVFDPNHAKDVMKAIQNSSLDLNPSIEGQVIMVPFSKTTREEREQLQKTAKKNAEETKNNLRSTRHEWQKRIQNLTKTVKLSKDDEGYIKDLLQEQLDERIELVNDMLKQKQVEIAPDEK